MYDFLYIGEKVRALKLYNKIDGLNRIILLVKAYGHNFEIVNCNDIEQPRPEDFREYHCLDTNILMAVHALPEDACSKLRESIIKFNSINFGEEIYRASIMEQYLEELFNVNGESYYRCSNTECYFKLNKITLDIEQISPLEIWNLNNPCERSSILKSLAFDK